MSSVNYFHIPWVNINSTISVQFSVIWIKFNKSDALKSREELRGRIHCVADLLRSWSIWSILCQHSTTIPSSKFKVLTRLPHQVGRWVSWKWVLTFSILFIKILPRTLKTSRGKEDQTEVLEELSPDTWLLVSHTCFQFNIKIKTMFPHPEYSNFLFFLALTARYGVSSIKGHVLTCSDDIHVVSSVMFKLNVIKHLQLSYPKHLLYSLILSTCLLFTYPFIFWFSELIFSAFQFSGSTYTNIYRFSSLCYDNDMKC